MGAGASATAGPSAWSPAKAQAAPATGALSDLSTKSGTPVAELLGMTRATIWLARPPDQGVV